MINILMDITDFDFWGNAVEVYEVIEEVGKVSELEALIAEDYPDGISENSLNDLLRFEYDYLYDVLDIDVDE